MSDNKKYYYLKLKENFFESDELIMLESMQDGCMYSNILLKLYLKSLKNNGKLMFNERIPYNSTILANITRHSVAVVEKAIQIFKDLGLIEILDNGAIYMLDIQNFIGNSSTEADRKRKYRTAIVEEKKTLLGQMSGQMSSKCPDKNPPEIEIEKEIEKEKEKDAHSSSLSPILEEIKTKWESTFHPLMKADELETLEAYIQDYGRMGVISAIETAGKRKNLNHATLSPRYLLPILKNPMTKPDEPRRNVIPIITDANEHEYWARLRREDKERQAEAKRLGEDDPYGIYGGAS